MLHNINIFKVGHVIRIMLVQYALLGDERDHTGQSCII